MIYSVTGELVLTEPSAAVISCGGVGYRMTVSGNTLSKLRGGDQKGTVRLFTYLQVREDGLELFGFFDTAELDTFKLLISVSGVGPKAAISILSVLTPERLAIAVGCGDAKAISQASGVGNKTAQRIILELKDKVAKQTQIATGGDGISDTAVSAPGGKLSEATNALMVLGYSRAEATHVLSKINTADLSLEDCITTALKQLMK